MLIMRPQRQLNPVARKIRSEHGSAIVGVPRWVLEWLETDVAGSLVWKAHPDGHCTVTSLTAGPPGRPDRTHPTRQDPPGPG